MTESQRAAMRAALEALKNMRHYDTENLYSLDDEINALRIALAEQTEDWGRVEALEASLREHMQEIHRLRDALAEQDAEEHKPGRHIIRYNDDGEFGQVTGWLYRSGGEPSVISGKPIYVWRPLRDLIGRDHREWVGLTDEEINSITSQRWGQAFYAIQRDYARDIEAALRKRNA